MPGSGFEILATHQLNEIGREKWDALSNDLPFASYQWHRFGERAMAGSQPLYICVFRHGEMEARASFWLVRDEPLPIKSGLLRRMMSAFLRRKPLLICRSPLAATSGLILPEPALRKEALKTILLEAHHYARKSGASFIVFDYLSPDQSDLIEWPNDLASLTLAEPGTYLPIKWESYPEYLKDLSKSARKDYRRQRNWADRLGLEIRISSGVERIEEAIRLIREREDRHGSAYNPWVKSTLENVVLVPATWISAWLDGRLVGCGLLLQDRDTTLATLLGLDNEVPYVYFQVVYQGIRQAIEGGMRVLRAGSGAYELKRRLGFQIEANNNLRFAGQTRLLRLAGQLATR